MNFMWSHSCVQSPVRHTKVTLSRYSVSSAGHLCASTIHFQWLWFNCAVEETLQNYCPIYVKCTFVQRVVKNNDGWRIREVFLQ